MTQTPTVNNLSAGKDMMAESKFFMGYSRYLTDKDRYETWTESVARVMDMHREKYRHVMTPEIEGMIQFAQDAYTNSSVLGAQRALQFGGPQIFQHEGRLYNCSASHLNRPEFFQEAMYLLLCGCGVGFSVQKHHVAMMPDIAPRLGDKSRVFKVSDSIEGWSDAFGVLFSSYIPEDQHAPFTDYQGAHVSFDFTEIRSKGAYISGGFKAPGSDGLRASLIKCEELMNKATKAGNRLKPIDAYDYVMHMSDAVLSGGVRRSATLCMFSKDDQEMLNAKTGNWFMDNAQRGRSNNSVVLLRDETTYEEWQGIKASVKEFGEPGFIWTDSLEFTYNPLNVAA